MPSGPKKRQAARRRKLKEEEQQQHKQGSSIPISSLADDSVSESLDDEDQIGSPTVTVTSTVTNTTNHINAGVGGGKLVLLDLAAQQKLDKTEEWVRESSFDVGTPPPLTPSNHHDIASSTSSSSSSDHDASDNQTTNLKGQQQQQDELVVEKDEKTCHQTTPGCCGVLAWLLGR